MSKHSFLLAILPPLLAFIGIALSSDPDPLHDYCITDPNPSIFINGQPCTNPNKALPSHFATAVLATAGNTAGNPFGFNVTLTTSRNLPGSNTQGLAMARVDIAGNGLVPTHSHPRASEVTVVLKGSLLVGFVDTANRLFTQQLRVGDSFIFPRGLLHFLYNLEPTPALALSGLNSQNPGAEVASLANFATRPPLPDDVLIKSFRITGQDVQRIRKNLGG